MNIYNLPFRDNELRQEYLGTIMGLNSFISMNSSPRMAMFSTHYKQHVLVKGMTKKSILSGIEHEYANDAFKSKIPVEARIVAVVQKYPTTRQGAVHHAHNNETIVLYQDLECREGAKLCCIKLNTHHFEHQQFGYRKVDLPSQRELVRGNAIPKGTILQQSPAVLPDGNHMYGVETNIAYMSIPEIIEDGFVISRSMTHKLASTVMGKRTFSLGSGQYGLNLYGSDSVYKIFPDIGQQIREDGLIFAGRDVDEDLFFVEMDKHSVRQYDPDTDNLIFAEAGATVTDIRIYRNYEVDYSQIPVGMDWQLEYYSRMSEGFYQKIFAEYQRFKQQHRGRVILSGEMHQLAVRAQANVAPKGKPKGKLVRKWQGNPLDEWYVEITYAKEVPAGIGSKISGTEGNGITLH